MVWNEMLNKKLIKYSLILLVLMGLFCSQGVVAEDYLDRLPPEVSQIIRERKKEGTESVDVLKDKLKKYLYQYNDFSGEIDEELIKISNEKKPLLISNEKANRDIEFFFKLLKYGYAGYQYFGGDQKFNKVEKDIIKEVKEKSIFSRLTTNSFADILIKHLNFIQDGHFAIDGRGLFTQYKYFTSPKFDFSKDKGGYYTFLEGKKAYLTSIDNGDYKDYLKLSLNSGGKVVYRLGTLSKKQEDEFKVNIKLKPIKSKQIKNVEVVLRKQDGYKSNGIAYNVYRKDGIPIIEHRTAAPSSQAKKDKLEEFVADAKKFKGEEYIIIDIRDHSGGADIYPSNWVKNFTGISPEGGSIVSSLGTRTANKMLKNSIKHYYGKQASKIISEYEDLFIEAESGWTEIKYYKSKFIDNDSLVVVLTDSGIGSAGESFVKYLRQLKNVIFIGTNTSGIISFGNMGIATLPDSKLKVSFPKSIFLETDLKFREGLGYLPDIWVNPEKAVELALKFINYYFKQ